MLSSSSPLAAILGEGYEPRPQQVQMARAVASALAGRSRLLVEAGTGVGKSFAYLAPAIERICEHGETVVVATNTIALQEQLLTKDVPVLLEAFGDGRIRPVLVKGRGNYLSIRRLKLASERSATLVADGASRLSLRQLEDWAYETDDGTLSTLPALERPEVWDHARSDADNCMGRKCPHYEECFYQNARREAEKANLLICNHALFFADLALRAGGASILPDFDHVILDEAHGIEDVASDHFGLKLTSGRVHFLLRTLYDARRGKGYLATLYGKLSGETAQAAAHRAIEQTLACHQAAEDFFGGWLELWQSGEVRGRLGGPQMVDNSITPAFGELSLRLASLREKISREEDRFELASYRKRAVELAETAEALCEQTLERSVYWLEVEQARGRPRLTLACAPIEVREPLREHLFNQDWGVVLTSATLATRTASPEEPKEHAEAAFAHAIGRLGCDGAQTLQLGSPFDYATQVQLFVDRSMPAPSDGQNFADALLPRILDHVSATDGGAFVLFTSFSLLNRLAAMLDDPCAELQMPLLVHGRDGPRQQLIERFRDNPRSVLCGTSSFWQGVDIRGDALRNVIITRLPFEPPDRPLTEARLELIRARGGDPFREDSLPRAVIRFKQGFGRLIRSASDRGRVVVLDPRLLTKPYGRMFLRSLPEGLEPVVLSE